MQPDKIRMVGEIHYTSKLKDGQGTRIANDFLCSLAKEFAKCSARYMRTTQEAPFIYKERQLHSVLAPALANFTQAFLMESPTKRCWSATNEDGVSDSHGWIDYWCYYRNLSFLLELKHGFISSRFGQIRKNVKEEWQKAIVQLDAIEDEAKRQSEWTKGSLRVALRQVDLFKNCKETRIN